MKNRCKATVRTAQQQRRRCSLCLKLHYTMQRFAVYLKTGQRRGYPPSSLRQLYAFGVMLSSTVICLRRDICPLGKLWIYLSFGDRQNITLTKSKYNLRSKYNRFALRRMYALVQCYKYSSVNLLYPHEKTALSDGFVLVLS